MSVLPTRRAPRADDSLLPPRTFLCCFFFFFVPLPRGIISAAVRRREEQRISHRCKPRVNVRGLRANLGARATCLKGAVSTTRAAGSGLEGPGQGPGWLQAGNPLTGVSC